MCCSTLNCARLDLQVAAFLQDSRLSELSELLAPHVRALLHPWAVYGGTTPHRNGDVQADCTAEDSTHARRSPAHRCSDIDSPPPRQRRRCGERVQRAAAASVLPPFCADASAAQRITDLLAALPPDAAAAALATQKSPEPDCLDMLWVMLAALPPALHGTALRAHCTTQPSGALRLCLGAGKRLPLSSGASTLPAALRSLRRLSRLTIWNSTTVELCELLRASSHLQRLTSLCVCPTRGAWLWPGFEREFAPLMHLRALQLCAHELADTSQPQERHAMLPFVLLGHLPRLERLSCGAQVHVQGGLGSVAPPMCAPTALTWLSLASVELGDCAALIASGARVSGLSSLRFLELSYSGLTDGGAAALAAALPPRVPELLHLVLTGNPPLHTDGQAALARIIARAPALRSLDLSAMSLAFEPGAPVTTAVAGLTALTSLSLQRADLGDSGARALAAEALPALVSLRSLDVQNNDLTAGALLALVAGLRHACRLRRVWLRSTNVPQSREVLAALRARSSELARGAYYPESGWWPGDGAFDPSEGWNSSGSDALDADGSDSPGADDSDWPGLEDSDAPGSNESDPFDPGPSGSPPSPSDTDGPCSD